MQAQATAALDVQQFALAYVVDAHNIGCVVRFVGERATHRGQYSDAIQQSGVVIRTGHLVVVDRRGDPLEVIWRLGSIGTVEALADGHVTLNLHYRTLAILFRDERPAAEHVRPIALGDRVLLQGSPLEQAAITDVLIDGELAHPERVRAQLEKAFERKAPRQGD